MNSLKEHSNDGHAALSDGISLNSSNSHQTVSTEAFWTRDKTSFSCFMDDYDLDE